MPDATAIGRLREETIAFAQAQPARLLAYVLGFHLLVWTVLPMLVCPNLQLDLIEDIALGREWQLGYWKHPPLPWWSADLLYRLTGELNAIYLLGPLAAVVCFYGVWLLAREIVGEVSALVAVLALEGIHFYNFSVVKFAHDQMQLPFWAFTGFFFYRALTRGRLLDWALGGAMLAGAFWSKYAAFALAASLGLFLLIDPAARRTWRTPGPYVMALAFLVVLGPNLWWLATNDFLPFRYVDERALQAVRWYQYLSFPTIWVLNNLALLVPPAILLALLCGRGMRWRSVTDEKAAFDRRYVTMLALGPFAVTTIVAAAMGRLPVTMWAYPLWSFGPLAVLVWVSPGDDPLSLRRFAFGAAFALFVVPMIYLIVEVGEPLVRDRPKATQFPGRLLAETITREWHERTGTPLRYVGGARLPRSTPALGEFAANNVAVYSPDRPHVVVHGDPALSPWIDREDLDRRGLVLLWEGGGARLPENVARLFPQAELQPLLQLPRQTLYPRRPVTVYYAIVPPRP